MIICINKSLTAQEKGYLNINVEKNDSILIHKNIEVATNIKSQHPDSALQILKHALYKAQAIDYTNGIIKSLNELSLVYIQQGDYNTAQTNLYKAIVYSKKENSLEYFAIIYNNLGNVYSFKSQYDSAVSCYFIALQYRESHSKIYNQKSPPLSYIYNNLAFSHFELGNFEQTSIYLQKTRQAALIAKDTNLLANNMSNIAGLYFANEQWDSSKYAYQYAIKYALSNNNKNALFRAYTGLGITFSKLKNIDSALHYSMIAYNIYHSASIEKNGYNTLLCNIGDFSLIKKNYKKAAYYYEIVANDSNKTPKETAMLYARKAALYVQLGDYKKAYQFEKLQHSLNDSLKSINISVKISDLESRYELSQKNIALANSESLLTAQLIKTQNRNWWIVILSVLVSSIIVISYIWQKQQHKRQKAEQIILSLRSKIEGEEMEKNRIAYDLHDGVSSHIAAAKSFFLSLEQQNPALSSSETFTNAMEILKNTAYEVRNIAHNLAPDFLLNDGLIMALNLFCNNTFSQTNITYHLHSSGDFSNLNTVFSLNIYRIIQELSNNILKHAQAKTVTILLTHISNTLDIVVEDDGIGLNTRHHKGIGLQSVYNRVKMLEGSIQIESAIQSHTAFYINIKTKHFIKKTYEY